MILTVETILTSILVFFASTVTAVVGFGISSIIVPVLLFFYSLPVVISFAVVIRWVDDVWKLIFYKTKLEWRIIALVGLPVVLVGFVASRLVINLPEDILLKIFGVLLLVYSISLLYRKSSLEIFNNNKLAAVLGSSFVGLIGGFFGTEGPFRAGLLSSFDLDKKSFVFTSIIIAFIMDTTRFVGYLMEGAVIENSFLQGLPLFILATVGGTFFGRKILTNIPKDKFKVVIAMALIVIAVNFIVFT